VLRGGLKTVLYVRPGLMRIDINSAMQACRRVRNKVRLKSATGAGPLKRRLCTGPSDHSHKHFSLLPQPFPASLSPIQSPLSSRRSCLYDPCALSAIDSSILGHQAPLASACHHPVERLLPLPNVHHVCILLPNRVTKSLNAGFEKSDSASLAARILRQAVCSTAGCCYC
jgi:hypothetical protein